MSILHDAMHFLHCINQVRTPDEMAGTMAEIAQQLGFQYFALTHHVAGAGQTGIYIHNYPDHWAEFYAANALSLSDPVHRACHRASWGFRWAMMSSLIPMTRRDKEHLKRGYDAGIGDGYTVPVSVAGEAPGSCSFANATDLPIREDTLAAAQLVGAYAFHRARQLQSLRPLAAEKMAITDRQRDCVRWAARGKSDWEISRILGISKETATSHIKGACARYQVHKRIALIGPMLDDGTLTISDLVP